MPGTTYHRASVAGMAKVFVFFPSGAPSVPFFEIRTADCMVCICVYYTTPSASVSSVCGGCGAGVGGQGTTSSQAITLLGLKK